MVSELSLYNVSSFLDYFHKMGFKIMVLRGYDGLPDNYGGDLDIEIPAGQYQSFLNELLTFCKRERLRLIKYVYRPHVRSFKFYRINKGVLEKFILDISCRGGMWYGFSYLSNEELFSQARNVGKWLIPDPLHELVLKIFTNMLIGNSPPKKYFGEIKSRLPAIRERFIVFMNERFPGIDAEEFYCTLINGDEYTLSLFIPRLKFALLNRGLRTAALRSVGLAMCTILSEIYFYLQMNGLMFELRCDCTQAKDFEGIFEDLRQSIGHVWKRVIFVKADEATRAALCRFSWIFEIFRDRLIGIVVPDNCIGTTRQKESGTIYVDRKPAYVVLNLYKELEKRNRLRYQNMLYRVFLWRFTYSHVYGKWLEEIQREAV